MFQRLRRQRVKRQRSAIWFSSPATFAFFVMAFLCLYIPPIQGAQAPVDYYPDDQWRTSAPDEQGLDKKILKKLLKRIRRGDVAGIDSLLIVRNGYLVTEAYFNGWGPNDL